MRNLTYVFTFSTGRSRVVSSNGSVRGLCDTVYAQVGEWSIEFVNALSSSGFLNYGQRIESSLSKLFSFLFPILPSCHFIYNISIGFRSVPFYLFSLPHFSTVFLSACSNRRPAYHTGLSGIVYEKNAAKYGNKARCRFVIVLKWLLFFTVTNFNSTVICLSFCLF